MAKFQSQRKKNVKRVMYVLFLVPLFHLIVITFQFFKFNKIDKEPFSHIKIATIKRDNRLPLEIYGLVGNVFSPISKNKNIDIDLVPVSCTVDPITFGLNNSVFWSYNDLLRNALVNTFHSKDDEAFNKLVSELVVNMTANKDYIQYFINVPKNVYNPDRFELAKINQPFIWELPQGGEFHRKSKINYIAAIPIFHPRIASQRLKMKDLHIRLQDNLDISLRRFLHEIERERMFDVRTIGFAAIAASSNRSDSKYYLDYYTSYKQIIESTRLFAPDNVDRVFLFIHDVLKVYNPEEFKNAKNDMFRIYHIEWLKHTEFNIIIYLLFGLFSIAYLFYYPKIKDILFNTKTIINRRNFIKDAVGFLTIILGLLLLTRPILFYLSDKSLIYIVLVEFLLIFIVYKILLWVSKITRTNADKVSELNEADLFRLKLRR